MKKIYNLFILIALSLLPVEVGAQTCPVLLDGLPPVNPNADNCQNPTISLSIKTFTGCAGATFSVTPDLSLPSGFTYSYQWDPATGITPSSGTSLPSYFTVTVPPVTSPCVTYNLTINTSSPNLIDNGTFFDNMETICYGNCDGFITQYNSGCGPTGNHHGHIKVGSFYGDAITGVTCFPCPEYPTYSLGCDVFTHSGSGGPWCAYSNLLCVRGAEPGAGNPYKWGGHWHDDECAALTLDCSSLTQPLNYCPAYFWGQNVNLCQGETYTLTYYVREMDPCSSTAELPNIVAALNSAYLPCPTYYTPQPYFTFTPLPLGSPSVYTPPFAIGGCDLNWYTNTVTFTYLGPSGSQFICLYDQNPSGSGNAFGIDDISLYRVNSLPPVSLTVCTDQPPAVAVSVMPADGYPCVGTDPFTITGPGGISVQYKVDGTTSWTGPLPPPPSPPLTYSVPFTSFIPGGPYTISLLQVEDAAGCIFPLTGTQTVNFITAPTDPSISGLAPYYCTGDNIFLTATADYASPGMYGTTYTWTCSGGVTPAGPLSGPTANFSATSAPGGVITCVISNNCAPPATFTVYPVIDLTPTASATVTGCAGCYICPGNSISIDICGTPGATVNYDYTWPGTPESFGSVILPSGTGPACTTLVFTPPSPTAGTFVFGFGAVTLAPCTNNIDKEVISMPIESPTCNNMVVVTGGVEGAMPCVGSPYTIRIYGTPGTYLVAAGWGPGFPVTIPCGATYGDSPPQYLEYTFAGYVYGDNNSFWVYEIDGPCGCTVTMGTSDIVLCGVNVQGLELPLVNLSTSGISCVGSPFGLTLTATAAITGIPSLTLHDVLWSSNYGWGATTAPGILTTMVTAPPSPPSTGPSVYSITLEGDNGCSAIATIDVTPAAIAGPVSISSTSILCLGQGSSPAITITGDPGTYVSYEILSSGVTGTFPVIPTIGTETVNTAFFAATSPSYLEITSIEEPGFCPPPLPWPTITFRVDPLPVASFTVTPNNCLGTNTVSVDGTPGSVVTFGTVPAYVPTYSYAGTVTLDPVLGTGYMYSSDWPLIISEVVAPDGCTVGPIGTLDFNFNLAPLAPYLTVSCYVVNFGGYWFEAYPPGAVVYFQYYDDVGVGSSGLSPLIQNQTTDAYSFPSVGGLPGTDWTDIFETDLHPILPADPSGITYGIQIDYMVVTNPDGTNCIITADCGTIDRIAGGGHTKEITPSPVSQGKLSVIPNPNKGTFNISGALPNITTAKEANLEVLDMLGQVVLKDVAQIENGGIDKEVTLGDNIANGTYLIKVMSDGVNQVIRFTLDR